MRDSGVLGRLVTLADASAFEAIDLHNAAIVDRRGDLAEAQSA
jgi:hypothetical protein